MVERAARHREGVGNIAARQIRLSGHSGPVYAQSRDMPGLWLAFTEHEPSNDLGAHDGLGCRSRPRHRGPEADALASGTCVPQTSFCLRQVTTRHVQVPLVLALQPERAAPWWRRASVLLGSARPRLRDWLGPGGEVVCLAPRQRGCLLRLAHLSCWEAGWSLRPGRLLDRVSGQGDAAADASASASASRETETDQVRGTSDYAVITRKRPTPNAK